jgi:hypothetical protein
MPIGIRGESHLSSPPTHPGTHTSKLLNNARHTDRTAPLPGDGAFIMSAEYPESIPAAKTPDCIPEPYIHNRQCL